MTSNYVVFLRKKKNVLTSIIVKYTYTNKPVEDDKILVHSATRIFQNSVRHLLVEFRTRGLHSTSSTLR